MTINFKVFLLLFGLINYELLNSVGAIKEDKFSRKSSVDRIDEVTELNYAVAKTVPYTDRKVTYSMKTKHDSGKKSISNIKDIIQPPLSPEDNKSLSSHRIRDISDKKLLENNQPPHSEFQQATLLKSSIEPDQQKYYSIKLPNQNFHNQAMQLNGDYQGYITHSGPNFVQHPNQHFSEATQTHFGSSNFAPHFEALTQNKEKPKEYSIREVYHNTPSQMKDFSGNYYNTNVQHHDTQRTHVPQNFIRDSNNQSPGFQALHATNYGSNIQHHDQQPYNVHNPNIKSNDKPTQYGTTVTHNERHPAPIFHDENNQMPHFEAFTDYSQLNHSPISDSAGNGYNKHKTYFNNEKDPKKVMHNQEKSEETRHSLPNQAVLWNHKVYHDDNYQKPYSEKNNKKPQNVQQSAHAFTFNGRALSPQPIGHDNHKSKKHQKRSKHHRKHGHSYNKNGYLVNEHPEESQISQKNILPSTSKPDKMQQKLYINVEDGTIKQKRLDNQIVGNKSHVDKLNIKPNNTEDSEKNNASTYDDKEFNEKYKNIKPVHEDFDEKDASPTEISDEIRYFQDIYLAHKSPHETEFGHVLETPEKVEERFESNDRKNHRYKGKIEWTNKDGEFGQQFWDLGHLGGK